LSADSISFALYNDFFAGQDGHFTSGASLIWLEDSAKNYNAGISLEQIIITPENTEISTVQYDDLPYAGHLSLSTFVFEWNSKEFNEYNIEVGVIGKKSGAEFVQDTFHSIIGNEQPPGWSTQLGTHYTVNLLLQHGLTSWKGRVGENLQSDWFNHYGVNLGNFEVSAFGGTAIRIGKNYVQNFNVHYPYLKSEAGLLNSDSYKHGIGWSASASVETKVLAYSAILDRATSAGYRVHKNVLHALACFSGSFYYDQHKFKLFYEIPSPYFKEDNSLNIFGGIEYSYRF
jgi:hypothetical protein